jgi:hypothetical protein
MNNKIKNKNQMFKRRSIMAHTNLLQKTTLTTARYHRLTPVALGISVVMIMAVGIVIGLGDLHQAYAESYSSHRHTYSHQHPQQQLQQQPALATDMTSTGNNLIQFNAITIKTSDH